MSKSNPLAGLIGYGDSDEDSDDGVGSNPTLPAQNNSHMNSVKVYSSNVQHSTASIHPPPIPHCPWSACYDETSGFTYYWNHQTNAVTWEAPPEYLLALKLAQQQLAAGSTEVSAEEWQLYQQALADKVKAKVITKPPTMKPVKKENKQVKSMKRKSTNSDDEEKIELITSYSNTDSESESESPTKSTQPPLPMSKPVTPNCKPAKVAKVASKKKKPEIVEYGPSLPPNQSYTAPIGPELPPELIQPSTAYTKNEVIKPQKIENVDDQDETALIQKLKDKAKILENLGGELPKDLKKIIKQSSASASPTQDETSRTSSIDTNIDDLLNEIEKKELPKAKKQKSEIANSPKSGMSPEPEIKPLFPSSKSIGDEPFNLFPSAANIQNGDSEKREIETPPLVAEKKGANLYIMDSNEPVGNTSKRKLRISNSVLPERPKSEVPTYTTKYSQHIEGFSSERTGLGFSNNDTEETPKSAISYGKGLMFTKGETLNEQSNKDEDLEDMLELVELKLKHLNELQPNPVTPIQEMFIQLQTLVSALQGGALSARWLRSWLRAAHQQLRAREQRAPPPGWTTHFCRSEARYRYRRDADGLEQWEFPAEDSTDMDICDTPPHPGIEEDLPVPACDSTLRVSPPPAAWGDPPPPASNEPPPPGEQPLLDNEPPKPQLDELASFYNEIAEFENVSKPATPEPPLPPEISKTSDLPREPVKKSELPQEPQRVVEDRKSMEKEIVKDGKVKKKTKVKISTSMGMKHKTVSTLVAKWQQVADEIHSD